ncbi:MAG: hypothetical protein PUF80_09405, partial [Firmicutes bacterium]|nr:hypothetical protein [Bacillota bacterium]
PGCGEASILDKLSRYASPSYQESKPFGGTQVVNHVPSQIVNHVAIDIIAAPTARLRAMVVERGILDAPTA